MYTDLLSFRRESPLDPLVVPVTRYPGKMQVQFFKTCIHELIRELNVSPIALSLFPEMVLVHGFMKSGDPNLMKMALDKQFNMQDYYHFIRI